MNASHVYLVKYSIRRGQKVNDVFLMCMCVRACDMCTTSI